MALQKFQLWGVRGTKFSRKFSSRFLGFCNGYVVFLVYFVLYQHKRIQDNRWRTTNLARKPRQNRFQNFFLGTKSTIWYTYDETLLTIYALTRNLTRLVGLHFARFFERSSVGFLVFFHAKRKVCVDAPIRTKLCRAHSTTTSKACFTLLCGIPRDSNWSTTPISNHWRWPTIWSMSSIHDKNKIFAKERSIENQSWQLVDRPKTKIHPLPLNRAKTQMRP